MCESNKLIVIRANGGIVNTNLVLGSMSHLYRLSYCAEGQYQKRKKTKTITKSVRKNANDIDCFMNRMHHTLNMPRRFSQMEFLLILSNGIFT